MYLTNIAVDEETDEEVIQMVREHANVQGIWIMGQIIIRNRTYTDVVGCKIIIPVSQVNRSLLPDEAQ
jgi:hypothetical protein